MLPKTQILQKLTYPILSKEFEWADDGIKLDGTLFKLEDEEMAIVLFKGEKNPFLLTDKKIHVLYEGNNVQVEDINLLSGKELKIQKETDSYTLKLFFKYTNTKKSELKLVFIDYSTANAVDEIIEVVSNLLRKIELNKFQEKHNKAAIEILEQEWGKPLSENEKENCKHLFINYLKFLEESERMRLSKALLIKLGEQ